MPVEIKELVIRATYNKSEKPRKEPSASGQLNEQAKMEIIEACVEQILEILEKKNRR